MTLPRIGLLHPGQMGAALAATLVTAGRWVFWCEEGRSSATAERAAAAGARACARLPDLLANASVVISVCPPHGAEELAASVAAAGYSGLYADLNAISPDRVRRLAARLEAAGAAVVDGGIIGPPPWKEGTTRLYLAGAAASQVRDVFAGTALETVPLPGPIGQASAFKMAYAALSKGSAALAGLSRSLAALHGVESELLAEWDRGPLVRQPGSDAALDRTASVAWRWVAEMEEIADTARGAGLPEGLHLGAAEIFRRWSSHRDETGLPLEELLSELRRPGAAERS